MNFAVRIVVVIAMLPAIGAVYSKQIANAPTDYLSNVVAVKFKPEYKHLVPERAESLTGLETLDRLLRGWETTSIQKRFVTNPKLNKPGLPDLSLICRIDFKKDINPASAAEQLMQTGYFSYAEPFFVHQTDAIPNDALYTSETYLTALHAPSAWDIHKGENDSTGTILAIVDTGVNWRHPDLNSNIWNNLGEDADHDGSTLYHNGSQWVFDPGDINGIDDDGNGKADDFIGWDFMLTINGGQGNDPNDYSGHGTTVAGLADGRTNNSVGVASIAWNLKLMPISCSYSGSGNLYNSEDAFVYAAENGADVINYSAGGYSPSQVMTEAIDYAWGLGCIIFAAAGNDNANILLYPAANPKVVAVASALNSGAKAPVSSYGSFVDVCSPCEGLYSTFAGGGYSETDLYPYTSYATPVSSGLGALLRSYHPDWTNGQIVNQIIATCTNTDAVNPGNVNLLGDGLVNAYDALSMENPLVDQELRIGLAEVLAPTDANGNLALERNETFSLNLKLQNYAHSVSSNNVTFTLTCADADITILNGVFSGTLPADGFVTINNAFLGRVSATANTKAVTCTLTTVADLPVTSGSVITFKLLINAGGVLVWEGKAEAGYSGRKIRDRLQASGYPTYYTTTFPFSFHSFSAVFLSFGMVTNTNSNVTRFDKLGMYQAVKDYLEAGGRIFIEGNDAVGFDLGYYFPDVGGGLTAAQVLWPLLGISAADDGSTNNINGLAGQPLACTSGMNFTATTQTRLDYIDKFTPSASGLTAFIESGYGNVAIQNFGSHNQKSFVMSYCLAELTDTTSPSTRDSLILRIMRDFTTTGNTMQMQVPVCVIERADNTIELSWQAVPYAQSYRIEESVEFNGEFSEVTTLTQTVWIAPSSYPRRFYRVIARTSVLN